MKTFLRLLTSGCLALAGCASSPTSVGSGIGGRSGGTAAVGRTSAGGTHATGGSSAASSGGGTTGAGGTSGASGSPLGGSSAGATASGDSGGGASSTSAGSTSAGSGGATAGTSGSSTGGVCVAGASCLPANACDVGALVCEGDAGYCADTGRALPDEQACGDGGACCGGFCAELQFDPSNCGACGRTCPAGSFTPCSYGRCVLAVASFSMPSIPAPAIAVDPSSVYYTLSYQDLVSYDGGILAADLDGGQPRVIAWGQWPVSVAAAGGWVYWSSQDMRTLQGIIQKAPSQGGPSITLASGPGIGCPTALQVVGSMLYWADTSAGNVGGVPLDGGAVTHVPVPGICGLAVGSEGIFAAAYGTIAQIDPDGGFATLASGQTAMLGNSGTCLLALGGGTLYWATDNGLESLAIGAGAKIPTAVPMPPYLPPPEALVVDDHAVYVGLGGQIWEISLDGGVASELWDRELSWSGLAIDATSLYAVSFASPNGAILKITPK